MRSTTRNHLSVALLASGILFGTLAGALACDFMAFDVWPPAHFARVCEPDCEGRECGTESCGGDCGECDAGEACDETGACVCAPDCFEKECGPDGCGGTCGPICPAGQCCVGGTCTEQDCEGLECGPDPVCLLNCGDCEQYYRCNYSTGQCECIPNCAGRSCGPDPACGESCGDCPIHHACQNGGCRWVPDSYEPHCVDELCLVPAGPFMMGCHEAVDNNCHADYSEDIEFPYHEVNVPSFWMHTYQVTLAQYDVCVDQGACSPPATTPIHWECNARYSERMDHPVNCVSWYQARAFCAWAGMRLCSESEWEKAARGTDGRRFPWGNEMITCERAVFNESGGVEGKGCGQKSTWDVGSKPNGMSPYGVHDMAGNLFDWVEDEWHPTYEGAPTDGSAWVDNPNSERRSRRGGSYHDRWVVQRASARYDGDPLAMVDYIGFRCCKDFEE